MSKPSNASEAEPAAGRTAPFVTTQPAPEAVAPAADPDQNIEGPARIAATRILAGVPEFRDEDPITQRTRELVIEGFDAKLRR